MNDRIINFEVEPYKEYDERKYAVTVWFADKFAAMAYRPEAKYMNRFDLLPNVGGDNDRHTTKFCRVYQIKPSLIK